MRCPPAEDGRLLGRLRCWKDYRRRALLRVWRLRSMGLVAHAHSSGVGGTLPEVFCRASRDVAPRQFHSLANSWQRVGERYLRSTDVGVHRASARSEEHTSELQSHSDLVCRLLLEKKKKNTGRVIANEL